MQITNHIFLCLLFISGTTLVAQKTEAESKIIQQFELRYDLNIIDNPVQVRSLFKKDFSFSEAYLRYVTQQSPSWYLHYFHRNALQRYGWRSHWEFYQERFLIWSDWLQNPFRFQTIFYWNRPRRMFNFLTPALSPLQMYSITYFNSNWAIQQQIDRLKGNDTLEEIYGQKDIVSQNIDQSMNAQPNSVRSLVNILREKGVAIETHKKQTFVPLENRKGYYNRTREMALQRLEGKNSPKARNFNPIGTSGVQRSYAPPVNRSPARGVVGDVSTSSMGNSGGTTTVSAGREQ